MIGQIAGAIQEGFKLFNNWFKDKDKRRMETALEAAEKYIFTNENKTLSKNRKKKLLHHYKKRYFAYN